MQAANIARLLLHPQTSIADMSNHQFSALLEFPGVLDETSYALLENLKGQYERKRKQGIGRVTLNQWRESIKRCLLDIDKSLFVMLRN